MLQTSLRSRPSHFPPKWRGAASDHGPDQPKSTDETLRSRAGFSCGTDEFAITKSPARNYPFWWASRPLTVNSWQVRLGPVVRHMGQQGA